MMTRIIPELSVDTHETALYVIGGVRYWVTVRYGLVEVVEGDTPLPGTPEPVGTFETSEQEFRRIALKVSSPAAARSSVAICESASASMPSACAEKR